MIRSVADAGALAQMSPQEAAAFWAVRLGEEASAADGEAFAEWLGADEANALAWEDASRAWHCFDDAEAAEADEGLAALRAEALAARPAGAPRWAGYGAAAAALVAAVAAVALLAPRPGTDPGAGGGLASRDALAPSALAVRGGADFATGTGSSRTIALADGSRVTLDTQSAIDLAFAPGGRTIRLIRGRAFFAVAPDRQRPFRVEAGSLEVVALGTRFAVRVVEDGMDVMLVEGRVAVGVPGGVEPAVLQPGQLLVARGGSATIGAAPPAEEALSWQRGFVTFRDDTLAAAAAELNRYSGEQLVVRDPVIAGLRVSGMFRTGDPERFGRALAEIHPVRVVRRPDRSIEIVPAR
jgi:transmembrane sensor